MPIKKQSTAFRVAAGCAVTALLIGGMGLLGWLPGLSVLGRLRAGYIPMAPSTAFGFIFLSLAFLLSLYDALPAKSRKAVSVAVVAVMLFGGVEVAESFSGRSSGLEEWLFPVTGSLDGIPVGRMSPATGFSFLIAGLAVLFFLFRKKGAAAPAGLFGVFTLVIGAVYSLAYFFGKPLMYDSAGTIPMALTTAAAFVLIGAALIAAADRPQTAFFSAISFLLLTAGIIAVGTRSYKTYEKNYRAAAEQQLLAIADLKVNELTRWRAERLADCRILFKNPAFSRLVRRLFDNPDDADAKQQLNIWLSKVQSGYDFHRIVLLDAQAVPRLSVPADAAPQPDDTNEHLATAMDAGEITLMDFHRHGSPDSPVVLSSLVPIHDESGTVSGVLVLQIDPFNFLYPFFRHWPVPSRTAETLLVRREGDEVVFLNPLRFNTNTVLTVRDSVRNTRLPAAQAVLGRSGIVTGRDYRGVPVIAAVRPVPDSPWAMVARQDKEEILVPVRERFRQTVMMITLLLFSAAAAAGFVWRHRRVKVYKEKAAAADALRESNEELNSLINYANAPIIVWDMQFRITRFNHAAEVLTGRTATAVTGWPLDILFPPESLKSSMKLIKKTMTGERWETVEIPILNLDGSIRTVLWNSATLFGPDGKTPVAAIAQGQDITIRKQAERKLMETVEQLRSSNRDLEQFAYIASHDLQEPLRMVANFMQLLERRYKEKLDQDAKDFIGYAVDGAVRMQELIDSLLEYSRLHSRKKPFERTGLDTVLAGALRDLESRILEADAMVMHDPLPEVFGDPSQLRLIFQNLIGNALKFKGDRSPEISIAAEEQAEDWKITVHDNGIGIEPEYRERIFKIFQRLHSRGEYPGTGIGLAICRRIIERHGGKIGVDSQFGKGCCFWFTLPKKGENRYGRIQSN
jgi:PAS domain S-box-containing protein